MLVDLALRVPVERMLRNRRGPKKPKPRRSKGERNHHLATKKLLDKAKGVRPRRNTRRKFHDGNNLFSMISACRRLLPRTYHCLDTVEYA